jgi:hypothetical protein
MNILPICFAVTAACAGALTGQVEMIGDFENPKDLAGWKAEAAGARVELTSQGAVHGKQCGALVFPGSAQPAWPTIRRVFAKPQDWSRWSCLAYHYRNLSDATLWFWVDVVDADRRQVHEGFTLAPQESSWSISFLHEFAQSLNLSRIAEIRFTLARPKAETRIALDALFVGDGVSSVVGQPEKVRLDLARGRQRGFEGAFRDTLTSLYGPGLVDELTGLPYEFFSITERRPMQSGSFIHRSIAGEDSTEEHTPYMLFAMATGDPEIVAIERRLVDGMTKYLDPGDGLVGCYRWEFTDRKLGPFWGWFKQPGGANYQLSDAEHGAEPALYSILPGAWFLGHRAALQTLERYCRTLLRINGNPRYPHFHLYVGRKADGSYDTYDWDGKSAYGGRLQPDPAQAYSDIMEFWWILPMLGTAGLTQDQGLRAAVVRRVTPVMDCVARFQQADGQIATTYRMDGSSGQITRQGYMYEGGSPTSYWAIACYMMHKLTGDKRYLQMVERYLGSGQNTDLSLMIFHEYHTGSPALRAKITQQLAKLVGTPGKAAQEERWAQQMALASIYLRDPTHLQAALDWEKEWRKAYYREIGGYYYYFSKDTNHYVTRYAYRVLEKEGVTGHFISDHFRGPLVDLILINRLKDKTQGLIGRNLLLLGWLLPDPPRCEGR